MCSQEPKLLGLVYPTMFPPPTLSTQLPFHELKTPADKIEAVNNGIQHHTLVFHTGVLNIRIPIQSQCFFYLLSLRDLIHVNGLNYYIRAACFRISLPSPYIFTVLQILESKYFFFIQRFHWRLEFNNSKANSVTSLRNKHYRCDKERMKRK